MKNQKGFGLAGTIIIIVILAALGGGYYFYQQYQNDQELTDYFNSLVNEPKSLVNTEPADVAEDGSGNKIAGWKMYRNERYGFEFQYPAETEKGKIGIISADLSKSFSYCADWDFIGSESDYVNKVGFTGISSCVYDGAGDYFHQMAEKLGVDKLTTIDGKDALRYKDEGMDHGEEVLISVREGVVVKIRDHWYFLDSETFNRLIDTIKFY